MYYAIYIYAYIYSHPTSVIFFICPVALFLSLLLWRSIERSNCDLGLQKRNNVDSNKTSKYEKLLYYVYINML